MSITVEDGTGLADADAYLSVADADAYFSKRGNETWIDTDEDVKEQAIVRATFAIDFKYRGLWKGVPTSGTQALAWPRIKELGSSYGVTDENGYELDTDVIPKVVMAACAEAAYIELTERFLSQGITRDDAVASEQIGPLKTTWFEGASAVKLYPHITDMLSGVASDPSSKVSFYIGLTEAERNQQSGEFDPFDYAEYFNLIQSP